MITYLRLIKGGYAKSLTEAKEMDARTVIMIQGFEKFLSEYESTFHELNK